ncbi:MAG: type VI secretion system lipoprotein TssJ [Cellvibrionaceae bacterium]|nr:type VI secretion system lipoprotein TssJ [Cellvibrionaceae bacterium]
MMNRLVLLGSMTTAFLFIVGCSVTSKVWEPFDKITITAASAVNLDARQLPSPVQVKIYELSSRATFDNLDFDRAFYNASTFLTGELLSDASYMLQPSETVEHTIKLNRQAGFVAIVAGFIDIDNVRWKYVYPVKSRSYQFHPVTLNLAGVVEGKPEPEDDKKPLMLEDVEKGTQALKKTKGAGESLKGLLNK